MTSLVWVCEASQAYNDDEDPELELGNQFYFQDQDLGSRGQRPHIKTGNGVLGSIPEIKKFLPEHNLMP